MIWVGEFTPMSEINFNSIFAKIPYPVAIFDMNMRYLFVSQSMLDYYKMEADVIGKSYYEVFPEIDEKWKKIHQRALQGETLSSKGEAFHRKNLTQWIQWEITPWHQTDGKQGGIIIASNDISELKSKEEDFQLLAEAMPQIVWIADADGKNVFFNHQWTEYTGMSAEESLGIGWNKPFPPDDQMRSWNTWQEAVKKGSSYSLESRIRGKDENLRWWLVRGVPIKDSENPSKITRWFGTCTDIDEIKKNEEQLRQSEENFRLLVESAVEYAIYKISPEGVIETWNKGAERIKGFNQEEAVGKHFSIFYTPEDIANKIPEQELKKAIQLGSYEVEGIRIRKDGTRFWASILLTSLYDREQKLTGFSKVTRDITERKNNEEERKLREQYLLTIIHDMRTPLTVVKLNTQLIQKSVTGLNRIISSIDRADQMITDLLDVNTIKSGEKFPLKIESCELNEMVQLAVNEFTTLSKNRIFFKNEEEIPGYWSKSGIIRVLENLIGNAIKYGAAEREITVVTESVHHHAVRIQVHNWGNPIPKEKLEDIFEARYRILNEAITQQRGWGIGLTLVKGITEAHGGNVKVESSLEKGTTFTITLPADCRVKNHRQLNQSAH
jgi:PAS domain S-box-containing protein